MMDVLKRLVGPAVLSALVGFARDHAQRTHEKEMLQAKQHDQAVEQVRTSMLEVARIPVRRKSNREFAAATIEALRARVMEEI
mgnify:CR=1 FL=1